MTKTLDKGQNGNFHLRVKLRREINCDLIEIRPTGPSLTWKRFRWRGLLPELVGIEDLKRRYLPTLLPTYPPTIPPTNNLNKFDLEKRLDGESESGGGY